MSPLFPLGSGPIPKVDISAGQLRGHVVASQAPVKRSPWRVIRDVHCCDSASIIVPDDLYRAIWDKVEAEVPRPKYAKVLMKLEQVLSGDFFTEYIKKGNIVMVSEGKAGVDDVFSLREGVLQLQLSTESYERAGLQGQAVASGGRKHIKSRYLVEINLRLPSMLHGKKGFDRLVWAAKNVLNRGLNWVFLDVAADLEPNPAAPLYAHHPTIQILNCTERKLENVLVPSTLTVPSADALTISSEEAHESTFDILEYLDMLMLASPRVQAFDQLDPFLSRYTVPDASETSSTIRVLTYSGLINSRWLLELFCSIIKQTRTNNLQDLEPHQQWLAMSVSSFKTQAVHQIDGYTILLQPHGGLSESRSLEDGHVPAMLAEEEDTEMTGQDQEPQDRALGGDSIIARGPPSGRNQHIPASTPQLAGFQSYLCAAYSDSLI